MNLESEIFNKDFELIKLMVRYHQHKSNDEANQLKNYYLNQAIEYWTYLKDEYIYTEDFKKGTNHAIFYFSSKIFKKIMDERMDKIKEIYGLNHRVIVEGMDGVKEIYELNHHVMVESCGDKSLHEKFKLPDDYVSSSEIKLLGRPATNEELIYHSLISEESRVKYIQDNIEFYNNKFYKKYNKLKESEQFCNKKFFKLFAYIAEINGLIIDKNSPSAKYYRNIPDNYYILPNNDGIFGFNTWLYSHANGIILIGSSKGRSNYDDMDGTSHDLLIHDISHICSFNKSLSVNGIYTNLINSKIEEKEKMISLLILWVMAHEGHCNLEFDCNKNLSILMDFYDEWAAGIAMEKILFEFGNVKEWSLIGLKIINYFFKEHSS